MKFIGLNTADVAPAGSGKYRIAPKNVDDRPVGI
jgi:hypothetical protein